MLIPREDCWEEPVNSAQMQRVCVCSQTRGQNQARIWSLSCYGALAHRSPCSEVLFLTGHNSVEFTLQLMLTMQGSYIAPKHMKYLVHNFIRPLLSRAPLMSHHWGGARTFGPCRDTLACAGGIAGLCWQVKPRAAATHLTYTTAPWKRTLLICARKVKAWRHRDPQTKRTHLIADREEYGRTPGKQISHQERCIRSPCTILSHTCKLFELPVFQPLHVARCISLQFQYQFT